jgi:hypothetical protein
MADTRAATELTRRIHSRARPCGIIGATTTIVMIAARVETMTIAEPVTTTVINTTVVITTGMASERTRCRHVSGTMTPERTADISRVTASGIATADEATGDGMTLIR